MKGFFKILVFTVYLQKFCTRSGIEAPVEANDQSVLYCSKDFYIESAAMTKEFNDLFFKDRGNPSLCE